MISQSLSSWLGSIRPCIFALRDWSGVDFSGSDLRGFDFTGSSLVGCDFEGALIEGAWLDQAEIDRVGCDQSKRTDLRQAKDWEGFAQKWQRRRRLKDDHLHVGSVFQDAPYAPEMVVVPGGSSLLGETDFDRMKFSGSEVHGTELKEASVSQFAVSRFVVTWDEWKYFIRSGGRDAFAEHDAAHEQLEVRW